MTMFVTNQEYEEALEEVIDVMNKLSLRHSEYLERRAIELNMMIDNYEADIQESA